MTTTTSEVKRLRHWLPEQNIASLRELAFSFKKLGLRAVGWSKILTALYYASVSPAFRREQHAVVSGMLRHLNRLDDNADRYLLRRNTHRLEKALLMRPRRQSFALDYIAETVAAFARCTGRDATPSSRTDLDWARDVLTEYFSVVGEHRVVSRAREEFTRAHQAVDACPQRIPYQRTLGESPVPYESLLSLARRRRAVRWFEPRPVPRELLDQALLIAQLAPSSCNRQPYCYRFFDDEALVRKLVDLPMGTVGFAHNIPVLAAVTGDLSAYFHERDRHGIYVDASLSIMGFMLALETLGLSSCPLNWPDIESRERRAAKALRLPSHERIIMFMAIGFPDASGHVAFSQKRPLDEIRRFNE